MNNSDPLPDRIVAALQILATGMVRHAEGPWTAALVFEGVTDQVDSAPDRLMFVRGSAVPADHGEIEAAIGRPLQGL
ncbi:hypothetical protein [Methanothrix soehngenii]|uniref:hypothetical protein n=1 Tax=Methanothrix soehngenii TaxID=2223 RepID=UPI00300CF7F5